MQELDRESRNAPTAIKTVIRPEECPFFYQNCDSCGDGVKKHYDSKAKIKKVYNTVQCYELVTYKKLLAQSRLKGIQLEQTFEAAFLDKHNKRLYLDLQQWDYESGKGVYIAAKKDENNPQGNGTGKTYALNALAHKLCKSGVSCLYSKTIDFLRELKSTYDEGSKENENRVLSKYINVPVLLWDDLGKENIKKDTEWAPEKIYYIVDERVTMRRPIVISSNFSIEDLETLFGKDNHGSAIVSRLFQHCSDNYHFLGGPDRRFNK